MSIIIPGKTAVVATTNTLNYETKVLFSKNISFYSDCSS